MARKLVVSFFSASWHLLGLLLTVWPAASVSANAADAVGWMQLPAPNSPSARSYMAMTYDPASDKVVMFGGFDGSTYLNDTWTFDGVTWTQVTTPVAPPARVNMQMAYDVLTQKVVLFGGYNGRYLGDTWLWDGKTSRWTRATPAHSPAPVTGPMLFTGPTGSVEVYGGFDGQLYQLTNWRWTGGDWEQLSAPTPYARASAAVGVHHFTREVVLFGGLADVNPTNTWTYNGRIWTMQSPANQPLLVYGGCAAFDPNLQSVVLFGGASGGFAQHTSWTWSNSNWTQLLTTRAPSPREGAGIAYLPALGHVVIFGGQKGNTYLNDTWELIP